MGLKAFFFFLLMLGSQFFLQSCGTKSRVTKADQHFESGEYASAELIYRKIFSRIPYSDQLLKSRVAYNQAECLRLLNYTRAELIYSRAIRAKYPDSLVYLKYAQSLHRNGKYTDAAKNYRIFLAYDSTDVLAKNGLEAIEHLIPLWKSTPTRYVVRRQSHLYERNTYTYSPAFQGSDSEQLYFTSTRAKSKKGVLDNFVTNQSNSNIYLIKKDASGKWGKPETVFSPSISDNAELGVCTFSPDGRYMYFTRASQTDDSDANVEILSSARAGAEWTAPTPITFFNDSSITVAHPAIAPDGETFFFVSDAPNGHGGKDIWKGVLSGTECKFIENLGPDINTPGDEMFPVVRADGTLYFSSDGHPGFGGLDIFKAIFTEEETWYVENMGVPINSNYDDFGMAFEGDNEKGFFSSNRGQKRGFDLIWSFELPVVEILVQGRVLDDKLNPIPEAMVRLVSNAGQNTKVLTRKDGSYRIKIDKDVECVMLGTARGFLNKKETVSSEGVAESKVFEVDLVLPAVFRPVQLDNIFFEFAKWDLTPASENGLLELLSMLNDNPNIKIEISAHTDYIGNNDDNLILSRKRAKSVVDYLIQAGIPENRLVSVGHGEDKPYVVDENLAAQYSFLPLDTVLTEDFVKTLLPEEQEIANQINRRTEFKVLRMNLW